MTLSKHILTLGACMGLAIGLTLGTARYAKADCGDGVTTNGEACDNGTAICAAGSKEAGSECCKASDCTGGPAGVDLCVCNTAVAGGFPRGCNRDDVPNACRCNCMRPMCGDGILDAPGEQCDGGASASGSTPCLGNLPNSVCATTTGTVVNQSTFLGNGASVVRCTNNANCSLNSIFTGITQTCVGNPQCRLATCGDDFVCNDPNCTSGASPLSASPGLPGPETCDDSNTSNMDSCTSFNFSVSIGTVLIPDRCQANLCGDGISNMGVEECDTGFAVCITGAKVGKLCCVDADCKVGAITGTCSSSTPGVFSAAGNNADNGNQQNNLCRCNCKVPVCGDGISDTLFGDECDDGTTSNGSGKFCNKETRCIGGENGCTDSNLNGMCDSDSTENASRLAAALCGGSNPPCVKGTCSMLTCVQNTCGDGIVGGNDLCDDGNTVAANGVTDFCGLPAGALCIGFQQTVKPGCIPPPLVFENDPKACTACPCIPGFCGDGVTGPGEMCDAGTSICSGALATALGVTLFNPNARCCQASDCKVAKLPNGATVDVCIGAPGNRNDLPNRCRCSCMPPSCGDNVSDFGESCEPPASGTFCIKNAMGMCVLNTCGDDDVCNKTAVNSFGVTQTCTTGPTCTFDTNTGMRMCVVGGGIEECDDSNTINPGNCPGSATATTNPTDTCYNICQKPSCGDGVTSCDEQCDPPAGASKMGCSNMDEAQDAQQQQVFPDLECCYDGEVVEASKQLAAGLIDAESALVSLNKCKIPNAVGNLACDAWLQKAMMRIQRRVQAAELYTEQDDLSRATRIMRQVRAQVDRLLSGRRFAKKTSAGGACANVRMVLAGELSDIRDMAQGISGHLNDNIGGL